MGPPDFLTVDQGSSYVSKKIKEKLKASGIKLEEAPIESPGAISVVESYHAPLRRYYNKIWDSLDKSDATNEECLKMAVYASNATMGPVGLCPMLLIFGALPRLARITPVPTQLARKLATEESKEAVLQEDAKRRIAF